MYYTYKKKTWEALLLLTTESQAFPRAPNFFGKQRRQPTPMFISIHESQ